MKKMIRMSAITLIAAVAFMTANSNEAAANNSHANKPTPAGKITMPQPGGAYVQFRMNECDSSTLQRGYTRYTKISCQRNLGKKVNLTPVTNPGKGDGEGRQLVTFRRNQCQITQQGVSRLACSKVVIRRTR